MAEPDKQPKNAELSSANGITLRGDWEVRNASNLHAEVLELCSQLPSDGPSSVDCRQIEKLDLAGIQLVIALRKTNDTCIPIEVDSETSAGFWFGLTGVCEPNFDYSP